ncbi:MAG: hypothetical protein UBAL2_80620283 [Leptospirillum rubarum]|uniref:Uncharacterized protein n=1 Tax=Leptospirillum sp. Group II '5-way CG' TaxID=419541 RepID=B6AKT6_9BACT|nr:MAG: hypothetical protein UBAL2_80620283 [Leptospirillum rubarum]EDZ40190.1 MAG: Hypothetical protein CGL2_11364052 [Leptospirillum sp. Group II '5-way CG']
MAIKTHSMGSSRHFEKRLSMTVNQCRRGPFLPVLQVPSGFKGQTFTFSNQWGKCTVKNCLLTQTHQNIIDAIFDKSKLTKIAPDGQILVVFSPYDILSALGHKHKNNHAWLEERLNELRKVDVETEIDGMEITGGILRKRAKSLLENKDAQRRGGIATDVKYWYALFESEYSRFFLHDMKVHYRELLTEIFGLRHGVTQALVRFCLSHDRVNMALDDVLLTIGAFDYLEDEPEPGVITIVTPVRTQRQIRKNIRDEGEALKRGFGIELRKMEDGREGVFYLKHSKVLFESPEKIAISSRPVINAVKNESGQGAAMV